MNKVDLIEEIATSLETVATTMEDTDSSISASFKG